MGSLEKQVAASLSGSPVCAPGAMPTDDVSVFRRMSAGDVPARSQQMSEMVFEHADQLRRKLMQLPPDEQVTLI